MWESSSNDPNTTGRSKMPSLQYLLAGSKLGKLWEISYTNLAKVGVVGSNPIARSKILDLIEGSAVTT